MTAGCIAEETDPGRNQSGIRRLLLLIMNASVDGLPRSIARTEVDVKAKIDEGDCTQFTFVLYVGVFGVLCIFGLVGNTLSFLVLSWERHSHVATFLLQVKA